MRCVVMMAMYKTHDTLFYVDATTTHFQHCNQKPRFIPSPIGFLKMPSQKSPWLWLLPLLTRLALASGSPLSARAPANNTYDWNEVSGQAIHTRTALTKLTGKDPDLDREDQLGPVLSRFSLHSTRGIDHHSLDDQHKSLLTRSPRFLSTMKMRAWERQKLHSSSTHPRTSLLKISCSTLVYTMYP